MTTSTTIENKYFTNVIAQDWLTLKVKLNLKNKETEQIKDFDKYDIVIESM